MFKYILKNKNGSALPMVIILIPVLIILGATLLNISLFEVKQSVRQEKKLQAYYLAWSGADATASHIIEKRSADDLLNKTSEWTELPNTKNGAFKVNISGDEDDIVILSTGEVDDIVILSTGEVDGVTETVTLLLTIIGDGPSTPIHDIDEASGELDWLNGSSHNIVSKKDINISGKPVRFFPGNNQDPVIVGNNTNADFEATAMYFDVGIKFRFNDAYLKLRSEQIIFRNQLIFEESNNSKESSLTLYALNGIDGSEIGGEPGTVYGKVYFVKQDATNEFSNTEGLPKEGGAYYFPDGFKFPGDISKLISMGHGYRKTWK